MRAIKFGVVALGGALAKRSNKKITLTRSAVISLPIASGNGGGTPVSSSLRTSHNVVEHRNVAANKPLRITEGIFMASVEGGAENVSLTDVSSIPPRCLRLVLSLVVVRTARGLLI